MLILMLSSKVQLTGQNLLDSFWKFKIGDQKKWSAVEFDDTNWQSIESGIGWEAQGYEAYDGYAWYRKKVFIPAAFKKQVKKAGGFMLGLGKIDDADYTFFNGHIIGKSGELPPNYETAYSETRNYEIPLEYIKWDEENLIAIRVYDEGGGGGLNNGRVSLSVKGSELLQMLQVKMDPVNHVFLENQPKSFSIVIKNQLRQKVPASIVVKIHSDFGEQLYQKKYNVDLSKGQSEEIRIDVEGFKPGFYNVSVNLKAELHNEQLNFAFGIEPEKVVSPPDNIADLKDYWNRAKRQLAAVDPQYKMTKMDSFCTETNEIYLVEMRSLGNVLIRGWYSKPVKEGKYPAILHVQGYSSELTPENLLVTPDMVSFALNIRGHGNSKYNVNPGFPGYLLHQLHDKETYIYRGAYMDCRRAVDFLFSRNEVDTSFVAVEGGSQGGALSFATAALNNKRIAFCLPHVPFLSDFKDYFKIAAWPTGEVLNYEREHPAVSMDDIYYTLQYIDIRNLSPWVRCPVFMAVGLVDKTCPPHINFAAYNNLSVERDYLVYPNSGHMMPQEFYLLRENIIREKAGLKKKL